MKPACQALLLTKCLFVEPRTFVQAVEDSDPGSYHIYDIPRGPECYKAAIVSAFTRTSHPPLLTSPLCVHIMRAYYFDNIPGDQRLHHDSGRSLDLEYLDRLGLKLRTIPLDTPGGWEAEIDKIAEKSGAPIRDIMDVTKEGLGDQFEYMLEKFFEE
jgi:hypothetical protein